MGMFRCEWVARGSQKTLARSKTRREQHSSAGEADGQQAAAAEVAPDARRRTDTCYVDAGTKAVVDDHYIHTGNNSKMKRLLSSARRSSTIGNWTCL
jgi:hypothetical protein